MNGPSPIRIAIAAIFAASSGRAMAQAAELPVPCVAGVCGANIPGFVTSGSATATATNNVLRVIQRSDRAILNWASFNVGADGKVIFDQPNSNSIALNRIFQGSPSQILGAIEANGQIYLINQNGFMFGPTARVRTSGLMVSSLNMLDSTFQNGVLSSDLLRNGKPALESDGRVGVLDPQGNVVNGDDGQPLRVQIKIAAGAKISTVGKGGRVMIASRAVDNAGDIDTPDGQVILAAGEKVYLQASTDPALRGLLVEVDAGGEAFNRMTGNVTAARGNVTMVGLAVNQQGRVSATTSVAANGSIRLQARDSVQVGRDASDNPVMATTRGGTLELSGSSVTSVTPDHADSATAVDEQEQLASSIDLTGRQVFVRSGANVSAAGGKIRLRALNSESTLLAADADAKVRVEAGAVIDASGSDATASVSRNVVRVELRGNELRDSPLQRDGVLRGQAVYVDARVGTPIADVSGAVAGIGRTVDERTSAGGTITVESAGDVVVASGARFDVSGGTLTYTGGAVQTTQLLTADGRAVDIGQASRDTTYVGLINPASTRSFDRWGVTEQVQGPLIGRYEPGYVEGRNAGTLQFLGRALALDGNFVGNATVGANQRAAGSAPLGGRFIVGADLAPGAGSADYRATSINLVASSTPTSVTDGGSLPARPLDLSTDFLTKGGFTRTELYSNGVVNVPESMMLALAPGSSLRITAHRVEMDGSVSAASGTVQLASVETVGIDSVLPRAGVAVGDHASLDVSGAWNNELSLLAPIYRNGGTIDLAVRALDGELVLGDGVNLRADGGASLSAAGAVTGGTGGKIGLHAAAVGGALEIGSDVSMSAFGVTNVRGGSFTLEAPRVEIVDGTKWSGAQRIDLRAGDTGYLTIADSLFSDHGFSSLDLASSASAAGDSADSFVVRADAFLDARAFTLQLDGNLAARPSGGPVASFSHAALAPDYQRSASSVTLRANAGAVSESGNFGRLNVESGAHIRVDARGSVTLSSVGGMVMGGQVEARGGTFNALLPTPPAAVDGGYDAALGISFLDSARVDVSGTTILKPSDIGLRQGDVLAGGSINVLADRGSITADWAASFDARGTQSPLDIAGATNASGYTRRTIASAGGSITLRAPESIDFAAALHAEGGQGDTPVAGGTATIQLTRQRGWTSNGPAFDPTYPTTPRTLLVVADRNDFTAGANGSGIVDVSWLRAAGVDSLNLEAGDRIEFYDGANLSLARSLTVAAPVVGLSGDSVSLSAATVSIGTRVDRSAIAPVTPLAGSGRLDVHGDLVEFTGDTTFSGVASANVRADSELRLRGFESSGTSRGSVRIAGDLTLDAPVIYPTTLTEFSITAAGGANDRVTFTGGKNSAAVPYSVAGSLTVNARSIVQQTRLIAPFGQIKLNASDDLTLGAGSVTSVSANGALLPFGHIQLGSEWVYDLAGQVKPVAGLAQPAIELSGGAVSLGAGAVVDLKGGGDLYAYEWVPGTGGSKDALAVGQTPGLYAIMPSMRNGFAPYDSQEFTGSDVDVGENIYISGVAGLADGVYPLLPARFALLPGAYLVSAVAGTTDAVAGVQTRRADGTQIVAGYRTFANTGIRDARTTGFEIRPGSQARSLATYNDSLASTFDPAKRPLAVDDAARLSLLANQSFDLSGSVLTAANKKGRGASIDIAAPNLVLDAPGAANVAGSVNVAIDQLTNWNAASLLVGGRRSADGRTITVLSESLTIGSGATLSGNEVIAVARNDLTLGQGATLSTQAPATTLAFGTDPVLALTGADSNAAVLGVSASRALSVERGAATGGGGITLAEGSRVTSGGSLLIDGPGSVVAAGAIDGENAAWSIGSGDLYVGGATPTSGWRLGDPLLAAMNHASSLRLSASHALTFAESLSLATGDQILVDAPLLQAAAGVDVKFTTGTFSLLNHSAAPAAQGAPVLASTLSVNARDVVIGPGSVHAGFATTELNASHEIYGRGTAKFSAGGDVSLTAANIGTASDANLSIIAAGRLRTDRATTAFTDTARANSQLGGKLTLAGATLEHAGAVRIGSGLVELSSTNGMTLLDGSSLDVSGVSVTAAGRTLGSGGGSILLSAGGDLSARSGATLRASGAGDTDAGGIAASAGGRADFAATLEARAGTGARGGTFAGNFGTLASFQALNDALQSGGFTERLSLDVAVGDLRLDAGHSIVARDVRFATGGTLTIAGTIDASSSNERGRIDLAGGTGLSLESSGRLIAQGTGGTGRGGIAQLASALGDVNLAAGSVIALDGTSESGRLTLRASATADGMRLGTIGSSITGGSVVLQPVLEFDLGGFPAASDFTSIRNQVTAYANVAAPALYARYADLARPVTVSAGIDLLTDGDLFLGSLDLSTWRFAGEAATLAFRATGAIDINGTISDGYTRVGTGVNQRLDLAAGNSSSLQFIAGDSIHLGANSRVRTTTGDLVLRAAHDIVFDSGSSVYTAGTAAETTRALTQGASWALPVNGGRLELVAGNDVIGSAETQSVGSWQVRQATAQFSPTRNPGWGTDIRAFAWNAGTLGGGDLVVRAGHDIRDLSAAAADSASLINGTLTQYRGGVVALDAGNDVTSAYLHLTNGTNLVRAGGELGASRPTDTGDFLGSLFSMQQASLDVVARRGVQLEGAFNPTALTQTQTASAFRSYFLSYSPESALNVSTATGSVELYGGLGERIGAFIGDSVGDNEPVLLSLLPPSFDVRATDGDINIRGDLWLAPSDKGQLSLFAANDIRRTEGVLTMSDAAAAGIPTATAPASVASFPEELKRSAASGRHIADDQPVLINAGRDIDGAYFLLPKFAKIAAGRDVRNMSLSGQNVRASDATTISAGRDVIFDLQAGNRQIELGGPGRLDVVAARDVDLGFSAGISSVGRIVNPALATDAGADITVLAGAGASGDGALDVATFMLKIVGPTSDYRKKLQTFMAALTGEVQPTYEDALANFAALSADVQREFVLPVFFNELVQSGRDHNTKGDGFDRGYAAIDALFPGSRSPGAAPKYDGDLKLAFSRIYTLADADISLLVPGGLLNVGLANPPPGLAGSRKPSELGIVAQRAGSVRIFTHDDVLVNQARIFTLRGGDIAIWSTTGDIDAGRGAKSAISAPPPTVLVDPSGRVTLDFAGAVAGSGIRGIITDQGVKPGDVDLIAPAGTVNAGDAGIGAAGNLNVAAQQVVGLDNIQVGGTSTGVPAETSSLGASLSGASASASASSSASDKSAVNPASQAAAPLADSALGFLDVFLEGFGNEVCKPDDQECLQRNTK